MAKMYTAGGKEEILTELSERDSVQYRIKATEQSLAKKLEMEGILNG